ncbi:MAG: DegQ family serine endoprotease [bacterium]
MAKKIIYVTTIIVSLLVGGVIGANISSHYSILAQKPILVAQTSGSQSNITGFIDLENAFVKVAEEIKPAVVNLSVEKKIRGIGPSPWFRFKDEFRDPFFDEFFDHFFKDFREREYTQQSLGSGVIVDSRGYILTNNHVVKGADEIQVTLLDGRKFKGKVVGTDPKTDLALIKVDAKDNLPSARLGDSDEVKIGNWAIAIGNPFGLEHTMTVGVISAKGRAIGVAEYEDLIQTDASINPGNSGGPLVNIRGEVIGINTAIVAGGQGIGFAIPINMARKIIGDLIEYGKVIRAWLGVYIQEVTPELAKKFKGAQAKKGVLVAMVMPDSPAEKADLKRGDIILSVDRKEVSTPHELQKEILKRKIGEGVELEVLREGKILTLKINLAQLKEGEEELVESETTSSWRGITVQTLTPELAKHFGLSTVEKGVLISEIAPGSVAHKARLQAGDLIKEVNHRPIESINEFNKVVKEVSKRDDAMLVIKREKLTFFVVLPGEEE